MSTTLELFPPGDEASSNFHSVSDVLEVRRISQFDLSYNDFYWNYMKPNKAVVITSIGNEWLCAEQWIRGGLIDLDHLEKEVGNELVPVANCSKVYFNSHEKSEIPFSDYHHYWNNRKEASDMLYLKDWHLKTSKPNYNFYEVPRYFASDWLNEYLVDKNKDDYRFVYIGPKGSWTPFHADVFSSFSWSTNIVGLKKWLLLSPGEEIKLKDNLGNDPFSINEEILDKHSVRYATILQNPNESIFVPSGWYHQVWNMTDTISINHNWFNGCNIHVIWESIKRNFEMVVEEISDCKDMENFHGHCQVMLKSVYGIDFNDFLDILQHIANKRMNDASTVLFGAYKMNTYHRLYDLEQVASVLSVILGYTESLENYNIHNKCKEALETIEKFKIK